MTYSRPNRAVGMDMRFPKRVTGALACRPRCARALLFVLLLTSGASPLCADWREALGLGRPTDAPVADAVQRAEIAGYAQRGSREWVEAAGKGTSPTRGSPNAPITIIGFSDFDCPYCARALAPVEMILRRYPEQVRWVFKHFPLSGDENAWIAHRAARAAAKQGAFWPMHHWLLRFPDQRSMEALMAQADALGLDANRFRSDLGELSVLPIARDREQGLAAGVTGTPTFFVNDRKVVGAVSYEQLKAVVEDQLSQIAVDPPTHRDGVADNEGGPMRVTLYGDLSNPASADLTWWLYAQRQGMPGLLHIEFRHFPLDSRPEALLLHRALEAARLQGHFWQLHDRINASGGELDSLDLRRVAEALRLDIAKFQSDLDSSAVAAAVEADIREAKHRNITGAPTLVVNGQRFSRAPTAEEWTSLTTRPQSSASAVVITDAP